MPIDLEIKLDKLWHMTKIIANKISGKCKKPIKTAIFLKYRAIRDLVPEDDFAIL